MKPSQTRATSREIPSVLISEDILIMRKRYFLNWFQGHFTSINIRSFYISCFNRLSNFIFHIIRFTFDVWRSTIQSRPDIVDHRKKTELYRLKTQSFVFNLIAFLFRSNYKDLLNYIININYTCLGMARN